MTQQNLILFVNKRNNNNNNNKNIFAGIDRVMV